MSKFEIGQLVKLEGAAVLSDIVWSATDQQYKSGANKGESYRIGTYAGIGFTAAADVHTDWEAGDMASISLVYKGKYVRKVVDAETGVESDVERESFQYAGHVTWAQLTKLKQAEGKLRVVDAANEVEISNIHAKATSTVKLTEQQLHSLLDLVNAPSPKTA